MIFVSKHCINTRLFAKSAHAEIVHHGDKRFDMSALPFRRGREQSATDAKIAQSRAWEVWSKETDRRLRELHERQRLHTDYMEEERRRRVRLHGFCFQQHKNRLRILILLLAGEWCEILDPGAPIRVWYAIRVVLSRITVYQHAQALSMYEHQLSARDLAPRNLL